MREEFEVWVLGKWPKTSLKKISEESGAIYSVGNYVEPAALLAWESWKASRETLVVELPDRPYASEADQEQMSDYEIGEGHGGIAEWDKCRDAIHAAGVKTK